MYYFSETASMDTCSYCIVLKHEVFNDASGPSMNDGVRADIGSALSLTRHRRCREYPCCLRARQPHALRWYGVLSEL